jgi:hypothetical protein
MMAAFYLFAICSMTLFLTSFVFPHAHTPESQRLVWSHPLQVIQSDRWRGFADYRFLAGLLVVIMMVLYFLFS